VLTAGECTLILGYQIQLQVKHNSLTLTNHCLFQEDWFTKDLSAAYL